MYKNLLILLSLLTLLGGADVFSKQSYFGKAENMLLAPVTVGRYCAFLNAVGQSDQDNFYQAGQMASSSSMSFISREGAPGQYHYRVLPEKEMLSMSMVSLKNQELFCHWLENPQALEATSFEENAFGQEPLQRCFPWGNNLGEEDFFLHSNQHTFSVLGEAPLMASLGGIPYAPPSQAASTGRGLLPVLEEAAEIAAVLAAATAGALEHREEREVPLKEKSCLEENEISYTESEGSDVTEYPHQRTFYVPFYNQAVVDAAYQRGLYQGAALKNGTLENAFQQGIHIATQMHQSDSFQREQEAYYFGKREGSKKGYHVGREHEKEEQQKLFTKANKVLLLEGKVFAPNKEASLPPSAEKNSLKVGVLLESHEKFKEKIMALRKKMTALEKTTSDADTSLETSSSPRSEVSIPMVLVEQSYPPALPTNVKEHSETSPEPAFEETFFPLEERLPMAPSLERTVAEECAPTDLNEREGSVAHSPALEESGEILHNLIPLKGFSIKAMPLVEAARKSLETPLPPLGLVIQMHAALQRGHHGLLTAMERWKDSLEENKTLFWHAFNHSYEVGMRASNSKEHAEGLQELWNQALRPAQARLLENTPNARPVGPLSAEEIANQHAQELFLQEEAVLNKAITKSAKKREKKKEQKLKKTLSEGSREQARLPQNIPSGTIGNIQRLAQGSFLTAKCLAIGTLSFACERIQEGSSERIPMACSDEELAQIRAFLGFSQEASKQEEG